MVLFLSTSLHSIGFPSTLQILDQIDHGAHRVTLRTQTTAASAPCPTCGIPSRRVHGTYWRSLGDVACFGRPTLLLVRVRRFRCTAPACPRRTFAEPLPGVAQTRARQTNRLRAVHRTIGLALGGNPGARHAAAMGVPISRTTLLTRVRTGDAVPGPGERAGRGRLAEVPRASATAPSWSTWSAGASSTCCPTAAPTRWRRGWRTIPGCPPWSATAPAPMPREPPADAIQVADRWHLLRNSSDALRTVLDQHHRDLRAAARTAAQQLEPSMPAEPAVPEPGVPPEAERSMRAAERRAAQERRDARFAEVARLRGQGLSLKAIGWTLGLGRKTVRRWLR